MQLGPVQRSCETLDKVAILIKISVSDDNMFLAQTLQEGVLVVGVEAVLGPDVLVVGST